MIRRAYIPPTTYGVRQTLALMSKAAVSGSSAPLVREMAQALLGAAGGARYVVPKVRAWLDAHWREVPDPYGVELVRSPEMLLTQYHTTTVMSGDCDDVATLAASLALALGLAPRYVAVSFGPSHIPSHVFAEIENPAHPGTWVDMDVLRPAGPLPEPTASIVVYPKG